MSRRTRAQLLAAVSAVAGVASIPVNGRLGDLLGLTAIALGVTVIAMFFENRKGGTH